MYLIEWKYVMKYIKMQWYFKSSRSTVNLCLCKPDTTDTPYLAFKGEQWGA